MSGLITSFTPNISQLLQTTATTISDGATSLATDTLGITAPTTYYVEPVAPASVTPLLGTDGPDTLLGTAHEDVIYAYGGNDLVAAGGGDDFAFGGGGSDTIDGGEGNDHLYGYGAAGSTLDGADSISGGAGNDYIQGNAGNDTLDGGTGNDRILGGADNDLITGGDGNDSINGNLGNDHIDGGTGDDTLRGGQGDDVIIGGDGNDQIYGDLGNDTLTGGAAADVFHFTSGSAPVVNAQTLLAHPETITDYTIGEDHLSFDFHVNEVMHGAVQATADGAMALAQQLLAGQSNDVAAVQVGSDTYLFYNSGGILANDVIDLQHVDASRLTLSDFI